MSGLKSIKNDIIQIYFFIFWIYIFSFNFEISSIENHSPVIPLTPDRHQCNQILSLEIRQRISYSLIINKYLILMELFGSESGHTPLNSMTFSVSFQLKQIIDLILNDTQF